MKSKLEPPRRKRLRAANITLERPKKQVKQQQQQQRNDIEGAFEQSQQVTLKRIEFKLAANIAATVAQRSMLASQGAMSADSIVGESDEMPETTGFGVFQPAQDPDYDAMEEEELPGAGNEFVSLEEIQMNRISDEGICFHLQIELHDFRTDRM